ncbi:DUF4238 domain-containing protein [Halomonas denitrificans]|nr:DUF4238 domain-containing protein [Halomonas denitrificans]
MSKKAAPKQQHWVPKFYLKHFAISQTRGTKSPKVCVIDKSGQIPEPRAMSVNTLCSQKHLYTPFDEEGNRDMSLENEFSAMEAEAADYWPSLADGNFALDDNEEKNKVSDFLAALHLRNKRLFDLQSSLMADRDRLFGGAIATGEDGSKRFIEPFEKTPDPTDPGRFFAESTRQGIARISKRLSSFRWTILRARGDQILTSDIPITFFDDHGKATGPGKNRVNAIFPIAPSSILFLKDKEGQDQVAPKVDSETLGLFNRFTYENASRFVISSADPKHFDSGTSDT